MPCTSPRTVGFAADGKTICWSSKHYSREYATFQLPCSKCIECRLDYAREWAIRCVHEAKMHNQNAFITLTYDDAHLASPKLIYSDFQKFMKKVRKRPYLEDGKLKNSIDPDPMGVFVTGEYGEQNKRPHWHALIFNWRPNDPRDPRVSEHGDTTYESDLLDKLWQKGKANFGDVTFKSAGYCARYAAKKLVHGYDGEHPYQPISKKSSKHAIGKKWIEQNWSDVFPFGTIVMSDGSQTAIPRYYEKWFKQHHPELHLAYVTGVKLKNVERAEARAEAELKEFREMNEARNAQGKPQSDMSPRKRRRLITASKFKQLQDNLKL